mmetsp:Transcript_49447/g.130352  ORF Transcript_49447/g.130352 Transcript_49447/m.130352 type:complete len:86 (-) Transcript_49447:30-287(-)
MPAQGEAGFIFWVAPSSLCFLHAGCFPRCRVLLFAESWRCCFSGLSVVARAVFLLAPLVFWETYLESPADFRISFSEHDGYSWER